MNVNQIVTMIVRSVMRQLINRGVNAGLNQATRRMSGGQAKAPMSPEREAQMKVRQARRAARTAQR